MTETDLVAMIAAIDDEIAALLTGDGAGTLNYRKGEISVDKTSRIDVLTRLREQYVRQLAALPAEETTVYDDPDE